MRDKITSVLNDGLCTGCGTCVGLCPDSAIEMIIDQKKGIYIPLIDEEKCNNCGICIKVCPGHEVDFKQLNQEIFGKQPDDVLLGNYINCYTGYAADYDIRYNSSSGGLVTALLIYALEEGLINGALVTKMREDRPLEPLPFIARTREEIIAAAGSKYCPVPANIALKEIMNAPDGEKFAVVGLPCHIHGIRKAELLMPKLRNKIVLHLGLLCAHTDCFSQTKYILKKHKIDKNDVAKIDYRGNGWPGCMTILLKNNSLKTIHFNDYIYLHALRFFIPERCIFCADSINRFPDITLTDAWLPEIMSSDKTGCSIIITRNETGDKLCNNAKDNHSLKIEEITAGKAVQSQGKNSLANKDLQATNNFYKLFGGTLPKYNIKTPKSGLINYVRLLVTIINMKSSSKHWLVNLFYNLEVYIFKKIKTRI